MNSPYKNAELSVEARVEDLLGRMTLEEKVGQMMQLDGRKDLEKNYEAMQPGSFLQIVGDKLPVAMDMAAESRLGIPLLFGIDAIHGHSFWPGATIFPSQLGISCSWNERLIEQMARITAREMRHTGVAWTFSPVLCLPRDWRWGRVDETFGEDVYLDGLFGAAMVRGYQGKDLSDRDSVLSCAKHYAGYGDTQGGRDASESDHTRRKLLSTFLPPFKKAVEAGCGSFMTAYQSIDGVPCTANVWLLRETLKDEWGFDGLIVTDWNNVGRMVTEQRVFPDHTTAAAAALRAGNDMIMATPEFYEGAQEAIRTGLVEEALLDDAVRRILRVKFRLGLFEDARLPDLDAAAESVGTPAHRNAALQAARESAVLLRNEGLLPLSQDKVKRIAVIGPNADDSIEQLGDWSLGTGQAGMGQHPRESTITVLDGIRTRFDGEVVHARGCGVKEPAPELIPEAVAAVREADLAIVVVGDQRHLTGEYRSTATLELQGEQRELLDAVAATGKPMIVVLVNGKPLVLPDAVQQADAIIELFNPGMLGGQALAEILFGDINPCGRLTISFPRHVGQQPVFYSQVRGQHGGTYADLTQEPLFVFGEGLSFTTFEYGTPSLAKTDLTAGDMIEVTVPITNTGNRTGIEVVQAYVSDLVTSTTWVDRELKAFARVELDAGETQEVAVKIPVTDCSIVTTDGQQVVEPGDFELLVGPSSREKDLQRLPFRVV